MLLAAAWNPAGVGGIGGGFHWEAHMRTDEVRLAIGAGIDERFLKDGRTRERLVRVVKEMPHVLDQCAALFAEADAALEKGLLLSTRYGAVITPTFDGAELIADGSDDELIAGIDRGIKLSDILTKSDGDYVSFEEACKRGSVNPATNWGQRAAFALRDAGNAGKFSKSVWPVGKYVVCGKTRWRNPLDGLVFAWYVIRSEDGFRCDYRWFGHSVGRRGQFVSLDK